MTSERRNATHPICRWRRKRGDDGGSLNCRSYGRSDLPAPDMCNLGSRRALAVPEFQGPSADCPPRKRRPGDVGCDAKTESAVVDGPGTARAGPRRTSGPKVAHGDAAARPRTGCRWVIGHRIRYPCVVQSGTSVGYRYPNRGCVPSQNLSPIGHSVVPCGVQVFPNLGHLG